MLKIYPPIHALSQNDVTGCPDAESINLENGFKIEYCRVLDRPLTRYEVPLCRRGWQYCPYRLAPVE